MLARGIANFYSEFFKNQYQLYKAVAGIEEGVRIYQLGFRYLLMMMKIDEDQVFKITIDFFHFYIRSYLDINARGEGTFGAWAIGARGPPSSRYTGDIFREVMRVVCLKMAKLEEVLIVIDEDGVPVR